MKDSRETLYVNNGPGPVETTSTTPKEDLENKPSVKLQTTKQPPKTLVHP